MHLGSGSLAGCPALGFFFLLFVDGLFITPITLNPLLQDIDESTSRFNDEGCHLLHIVHVHLFDELDVWNDRFVSVKDDSLALLSMRRTATGHV